MPAIPGTPSGTARPDLLNTIMLDDLEYASLHSRVYRPTRDDVAGGSWWKINRNNIANPMSSAIRTDGSDAQEGRLQMERLSYLTESRHRKSTLTAKQRDKLKVRGVSPFNQEVMHARLAMASMLVSTDIDWWAQVVADVATASVNLVATGASCMVAGTALLTHFTTAQNLFLDAGVAGTPSLLMTEKALNFIANQNTEFNAYFAGSGTPSTQGGRRAALAGYLGVKEIITDDIYNSAGMYGSFTSARVLTDIQMLLYFPAQTDDPKEPCIGRTIYNDEGTLGGLGQIYQFAVRDDMEFHARSDEAHVTVDNRRAVRLNWA